MRRHAVIASVLALVVVAGSLIYMWGRGGASAFGFGRSTVPQRAQEAAPSDSETLSSRGNQRYEGGLSCWIIVNRS